MGVMAYGSYGVWVLWCVEVMVYDMTLQLISTESLTFRRRRVCKACEFFSLRCIKFFSHWLQKLIQS